MAHVILTVSDWHKSAPFYRKLGEYLGMTCVMDDANENYSKGHDSLLISNFELSSCTELEATLDLFPFFAIP